MGIVLTSLALECGLAACPAGMGCECADGSGDRTWPGSGPVGEKILQNVKDAPPCPKPVLGLTDSERQEFACYGAWVLCAGMKKHDTTNCNKWYNTCSAHRVPAQSWMAFPGMPVSGRGFSGAVWGYADSRGLPDLLIEDAAVAPPSTNTYRGPFNELLAMNQALCGEFDPKRKKQCKSPRGDWLTITPSFDNTALTAAFPDFAGPVPWPEFFQAAWWPTILEAFMLPCRRVMLFSPMLDGLLARMRTRSGGRRLVDTDFSDAPDSDMFALMEMFDRRGLELDDHDDPRLNLAHGLMQLAQDLLEDVKAEE